MKNSFQHDHDSCCRVANDSQILRDLTGLNTGQKVARILVLAKG